MSLSCAIPRSASGVSTEAPASECLGKQPPVPSWHSSLIAACESHLLCTPDSPPVTVTQADVQYCFSCIGTSRFLVRISDCARAVGSSYGTCHAVISQRTFNDFKALDAEVRPKFPGLSALPPRWDCGRVTDKCYAEKRVQRLTAYLVHLLQLDPRISSPALRRFFGLREFCTTGAEDACEKRTLADIVGADAEPLSLDEQIRVARSFGVSAISESDEESSLDGGASVTGLIARLQAVRAGNQAMEAENAYLRQELMAETQKTM